MSTLTAITDKLRAISPELEDLVSFLMVVQGATNLGGAAAATGLAVIDGALRALEQTAAGALTPDELMEQFRQAHADLAADRAGEDARLDQRFPSG
jgi:hypothetical protein